MLQEFKNDIYPRRLWVATSWDEVKDKFTSDYEIKQSEGNFATAYPRVRHKGNRRLGVLIVFNIGESDGGSTIVGTIAHESLHATKDRKSTRLNSSHANISYAVFCLKKKKNTLSI